MRNMIKSGTRLNKRLITAEMTIDIGNIAFGMEAEVLWEKKFHKIMPEIR